jgi:hypothetical protein
VYVCVHVHAVQNCESDCKNWNAVRCDETLNNRGCDAITANGDNCRKFCTSWRCDKEKQEYNQAKKIPPFSVAFVVLSVLCESAIIISICNWGSQSDNTVTALSPGGSRITTFIQALRSNESIHHFFYFVVNGGDWLLGGKTVSGTCLQM